MFSGTFSLLPSFSSNATILPGAATTEASWQHDGASTILSLIQVTPGGDLEHIGMEPMGINSDIDLTIHKDLHRQTLDGVYLSHHCVSHSLAVKFATVDNSGSPYN